MAIVGITGGVDSHAYAHVAAAVDHNGGLLNANSRLVDGRLQNSDDQKELGRVIDHLVGSVVSKAA